MHQHRVNRVLCRSLCPRSVVDSTYRYTCIIYVRRPARVGCTFIDNSMRKLGTPSSRMRRAHGDLNERLRCLTTLRRYGRQLRSLI